MIAISKKDTFIFTCHPGVPCFNECCRNLTQFLYPYDILRLTNHLKVHTSTFLEQYTSCHTGPASGLPVVTLRPQPGTDQICPFVSKEGCRVYPNRPSACRIYPLARAISQNRKTGRIREHFALLEEPHCRGREDGQTRTVDQWIVGQQLEEYNQANDRMIALISHKNQHHPGPLSLANARMFYLACYDFDTFRENILENGWLDEGELDPEIRAKIAKDDSFLLQFGMDWIQQNIMAE